MAQARFSKGDTVIHSGKPEWGPGDVLSAEGIQHEGKSAQRLTIRFARAGLKTISTAFAELRPAKGASAALAVAPAEAPARATGHRDLPAAGETEPDPDLVTQNAKEAAESLQKLPEEATDPFLPLTQRLKATLALYRFAESPAGMIDWAVTQTGMRDPLSAFSRHDLETAFERFRIGLDNHLRKLIPQARKASPQDVASLVTNAGPAARQAVRRVDIGR